MTPAPRTFPRCPICDRPPGDPAKHGATVCERFSLERNGLMMGAANKECGERHVDWRKRAIDQELAIAELREQLQAARNALSRRHAAQYPTQFRANARIE